MPLTEYDACIDDIRVPARISSRVMIQILGCNARG